MQPDTFDEAEFFGLIAKSGARALLIGRRAMIALGLPVLTADYDLWLHFDDVEKLNNALVALDMFANHSPSEARARGRYVIENGEHVDVMIAREIRSPGGVSLTFDAAWNRRVAIDMGTASIDVPSLDDLIVMKRIATRSKDIADIRLLEALRAQGRS